MLAFKVLDLACLNKKSKQLALTACSELNFSSMKLALKRIFGEKTTGSSNGIQVNQDSRFSHNKDHKEEKNGTLNFKVGN